MKWRETALPVPWAIDNFDISSISSTDNYVEHATGSGIANNGYKTQRPKDRLLDNSLTA